MLTLHSPEVVQETVKRWKRDHKIAFVPTMGCLHEGHLRLVSKAQELGQKTIVSIFVNPLQFRAGEDFERYPRTLDDDARLLDEMKVDLLFAPSVGELYPDGFSTRVSVGQLSEHLCGISRPGHFEGVATVCLKLFEITQADVAVFGEKDFQQLRIIQRMTADLNLPLTIVPHPTVREADGLALSSRNRYLSSEERSIAVAFPETLKQIKAIASSHPVATVADILGPGRERLQKQGITIDYLEIASEKDLVPAKGSTRLTEIPLPRVFGAVKIGQTRLIDNWRLHEVPA